MEAEKKAGLNLFFMGRAGSPLFTRAENLSIPTLSICGSTKFNLCAIFRLRHLIWNTLSLEGRGIKGEGGRAVSLHCHTAKDLWIASPALWGLRGIRLILSLYIRISSSRKDFLHRLLYRRVDGVVVASEGMRQDLIRNLPISSEKIHRIPYGRDLVRYQVSPAARERVREGVGIPRDAFVIGTLSRLDPEKGILEAVCAAPDVLRKYPDAHFLIVGGPTTEAEPYLSYERTCRTAAEKSGFSERIHFVGYQENYPEYLSAMDILLLPSYKESYSLSVLDAFGMGIPAAATNSGGTPEAVIPGKTGILFEPQNIPALARALCDYLSHRDVLRQDGLRSREFVQKEHDLDKIVPRFIHLYSQAAV